MDLEQETYDEKREAEAEEAILADIEEIEKELEDIVDEDNEEIDSLRENYDK